MSSNAINQIKNAEDKAKIQVEDARKESLEIQEKMKIQGAEKYNGILKEAEQERQKILDAARNESKEIELPIIQNAEKESESILNKDNTVLNDIADTIVERIVKDYVDS